MKVLVAEDNKESRYLLEKLLQGYGHEVTAVANGVEALEQALAQAPDIIVSDIMMPKMDGFQLCQECKQNEQLKNIPFIFYTATYTSDEDEKFALSLGANAFILKPTEPDILVPMLSEEFEKAKPKPLAPDKIVPLEPSFYLSEYNKRIVAKLEDKVAQLDIEIAERKRAEERIRRLNSLLKAIRYVNQLVVKEKNRDSLLQKTCDALIEARGYDGAWLGFLKDKKTFATVVGSGLGKDVSLFSEHVMDGDHPPCIKNALVQKDMVVIVKKPRDCGDCFFKSACIGKEAAVIRIELADRFFGLLAILFAPDVTADEEEKGLLKEVACDIAFGLHDMELEKERKQLEAELLVKNEVFEASITANSTSDNEGILTYVNSAFIKIFGYENKEEAVGKPISDFLKFEDEAMNIITALNETGVWEGEYTGLRKDGTTFAAYGLATIIKDRSGDSIGYQSAVLDISDRKRMEEILRESEEKYSSVVENSMDGIIVLQKGIIKFLNQAILGLTGYNLEELIDKEFETLLSPEYRKLVMDRYQARLAGKDVPSMYEMEIIRKDGISVPIEVSNTTITYGGEKSTLSFLRNITERKQAEEALRESEIKYRRIFENIQDIYYESSLDGTILEISPSIENISQYKRKELIGRSLYDIYTNPEERDEFVKFILDKGKVSDFEISLTDKDGSQHACSITTLLVKDEQGNPIKFVGSIHDISERKQAEEERKKLESQLQQAQKMEAIGTLAGGIAHDFNNILAAIIGYTEIASLQVAEDNKAKESLKEVLKAGLRAKNLVKQILAFSRKGEQERMPVQISLIVKEALKLLRSSLPTTIEIRQNIESDTGIVEADPTQIHQILMNLCTNAGHAMREEGGVLEVGIRDVEVGSWDSELGDLDMTPGPYLLLTVSDTGEGMAPEILGRIFDPYFTTKEKGVGTGLGLAVVDGIVKIYGGTIRAYSEPGKGTTFHVYLPRIEEAKEMAEEESRPGVIPTGQERILFIDDEPVLVEIGKQMLERLGYEVTTRTSSIEALELFKAKPDRFDLVITDMTMPQMTGDRLSREIMQIRPDIPIILCTGFSKRITEEKAKGIGIKAFAMKPIVIRDLANTVREVLEGGKEKPAEGLILVIDDDDQLRGMLREMLERAGYEVADAPNGKEGIRLYRENPADLVITDIIMPEKEGIETIMDLRREFPEVKIIAMSGGGRIDPEEYLHMAKRLGADRTFAKPVEREELLKAVREVLGT